jgi:hypothetical protein
MGIDSMSAEIRFPPLYNELEQRIRVVTRAFIEKVISDVQVIKFFFQYFFQRLELMYENDAKLTRMIQKVLYQQQFAIIVPRLVEVTVIINSIKDLDFKRGADVKDPSITFDSLKTVLDIFFSNTTILKAYTDRKLKIKKIPEILKWLAPISSIQTDETLKRVQEQDLELVSKLLSELGY